MRNLLIHVPVTPENHKEITSAANLANLAVTNYILRELFGDEDVKAVQDTSVADAAYDADKGNTNNGRPQKMNRSLPGEGRTAFLGLRVTEAEKSRLRYDARQEGLTVNAYVSQALMLPISK